MNGNQFLTTLKKLGYPQASNLDAQTFDWIFENDAVLPFLEWFCDHAHALNVLQDRELREYRTLEESTGVLEGPQLQDALNSIEGAEDDIPVAELREHVNSMKMELDLWRGRKESILRQRNKLSLHNTSVNHKLSKLGPMETVAKKDYKRCLEQSQADNSKVNAVYENITEAVSKLSSFYGAAGGEGNQSRDMQQAATFLSQMSLEDHQQAEECFTQELATFTKKQFFQGIAEVAGNDEESRYEFLDISSPENLLIRGEKADVNMSDCRELARLQAIYAKTESQYINAVVEEQSLGAACKYAEQKLSVLRKQRCTQDVSQLSSQLQDAQSSLSGLQKGLARFTESELPVTIRHSASLQESRILRGDYDLKIARQNYFSDNQDKVVEELIKQRSRNEFLTMAYEAEERGHRDTHRLLTAVSLKLKRNLKEVQNRLEMMADPGLSGMRYKRNTIDSRDKFLNRLYEITAGEQEENKNLFQTFAGLAEGTGRLHQRLVSLQGALTSANSSEDHMLAVLEKNLSSCEALVYSGSSSTAGQPLLSPQKLLDSMAALDDMLKKLEHTIMDAIKDLDAKKKILKTDPLQKTERQLFYYFHNNPQRLEDALQDVSARLQAQQIS